MRTDADRNATRLPWMRFFPNEHLADTMGLTLEAAGAYLRLRCHYWNRGALPDDDALLARLAMATGEEWARIRPALADLFAIVGGEWRDERLDEERERAMARHALFSGAGKEGARRRWGARNREGISPPNSLPNGPAYGNKKLEVRSKKEELKARSKAKAYAQRKELKPTQAKEASDSADSDSPESNTAAPPRQWPGGPERERAFEHWQRHARKPAKPS